MFYMKNLWVLIVCCFLCTTYAHHDTNSWDNRNTVNINIGIVTTEFLNRMAEFFDKKMESLRSGVGHSVDASHSAITSLFLWCINNKIKLIFYSLLSGYAYLHYVLAMTKYHLACQDHWSLWNRTLSFESMIGMPQAELCKSLVIEVQRRYTLPDNPEDFLTPLTVFLHKTEEEQRLLQRYVMLCSWIKKTYLAKVVWFDDTFCMECHERLHRLAYLKKVFLSWVAEYKLTRHAAVTA